MSRVACALTSHPSELLTPTDFFNFVDIYLCVCLSVSVIIHVWWSEDNIYHICPYISNSGWQQVPLPSEPFLPACGVLFYEIVFYHIAQAISKFWFSHLSLLNAGITGMCHHILSSCHCMYVFINRQSLTM